MNRHDFGQRMKQLRKARNWTQQYVADQIGIKRPSYTAWERGTTKKVRDENLLAAARLYETTPEFLLTGQNPPPSPVAALAEVWDKLTPSQKNSIREQAESYAHLNQEVLDSLKK